MISSSRQLKDKVRNLSQKTGVPARILMRQFMMERFLERVSLSVHREKFILKGGLLISSFLGVDLRTTMDIDTTIRGLPVTEEDMRHIISEICDMELDDHVTFVIKSIGPIMDEAEYSGIRASMDGLLENSVIPWKIDISTGDVITPGEVLYEYHLMFEDRTIQIKTYPIETVLAEKIETVIERSVTNTRMRDFYDIHMLWQRRPMEIDTQKLSDALKATSRHRNSLPLLENAETILQTIEADVDMQDLWAAYQGKNEYTGDYSWTEVLRTVRQVSRSAGLQVKQP